MKRFIKEYANYTLNNLKGTNKLYREYMTKKIDITLKMYERGLMTENECIMIIGNFKKCYFTIYDGIGIFTENKNGTPGQLIYDAQKKQLITIGIYD